MQAKNFALILLVVLLVVSTGWILSDKLVGFFSAPEAGPQRIVIPVNPMAENETPAERILMPPRHPLAPPVETPADPVAQPVEPPLPTVLDQADAYLQERLPQLIAERKLLVLVELNYFIQKLVLFIDNLPQKSIPRLHLPLTPPEPGFVTQTIADQTVIAKKNATRYSAYVRLVEAIPDATLLSLYRGLYPLFQQAYREGSGPGAHFNDRLVQVIDDLLQTPEPGKPIPLIHHVSRYQYLDEGLEARSAGQKILLRMGVENTRRVKAKLLRLRKELARKAW